MAHNPAPLMVEVTRGDMVESRHAVSAAVVDADGEIVASWGDVGRHTYPRSAIKPLQAIPLVASGAADAFGVTPRELALACASHMGQAIHIETVGKWLGRIDCSVADLECGAHMPRDEEAHDALVRHGETCTAIHNNCSGKHTGFLTTAKHLGEATGGYIGAGHPVQQRLARLLGALGGEDISSSERGIDGCGIPVLGMSVAALARAMARMAAPETLAETEAEAARRIFQAMTTHPEMVRGTRGFDTLFMTAGRGRFATKTGAEGVHIAIVPELKLGVALKVEDGAGRASDVAVAALLDHLGVIDDKTTAAIAPLAKPAIVNAAGRTAGEVRMAADWRG
jgi:L-asparaginase II